MPRGFVPGDGRRPTRRSHWAGRQRARRTDKLEAPTEAAPATAGHAVLSAPGVGGLSRNNLQRHHATAEQGNEPCVHGCGADGRVVCVHSRAPDGRGDPAAAAAHGQTGPLLASVSRRRGGPGNQGHARGRAGGGAQWDLRVFLHPPARHPGASGRRRRRGDPRSRASGPGLRRSAGAAHGNGPSQTDRGPCLVAHHNG